jgi:hypothetical protein
MVDNLIIVYPELAEDINATLTAARTHPELLELMRVKYEAGLAALLREDSFLVQMREAQRLFETTQLPDRKLPQ